MKTVIDNVSFNKQDGTFSVTYCNVVTRGRRKGDTYPVIKRYAVHNLPADVRMWLESPLILKEEVVTNRYGTTIVGSHRSVNTKKSFELEYTYTSGIMMDTPLCLENADTGEYIIVTKEALSRALTATAKPDVCPWRGKTIDAVLKDCSANPAYLNDLCGLLPYCDIILTNMNRDQKGDYQNGGIHCQSS